MALQARNPKLLGVMAPEIPKEALIYFFGARIMLMG